MVLVCSGLAPGLQYTSARNGQRGLALVALVPRLLPSSLHTSFGLRGCHAFADRPKQHRPCRITAKACGSLTGGHAFGVSPQGCRCSAGAPKAWHPTHFTHATHTDREMCATMRLLPGALVPRLPPGNVLPPGLCPDFLQTPSTVPRLNASSLHTSFGLRGCHAFADRPKQHRPCRITAKACGSLTGGHAFGVSPQGCRCSAGAPKAWHPTHFTHATHTDREMCATMRLNAWKPRGAALRLDGQQAEPAGLCVPRQEPYLLPTSSRGGKPTQASCKLGLTSANRMTGHPGASLMGGPGGSLSNASRCGFAVFLAIRRVLHGKDVGNR